MKLTTSLVLCAGILFGIFSTAVSAHVFEGKRRSESLSVSPPADAAAPVALPSQKTPQEQAAARRARHEAAVDAHWHEPVDSTWANDLEAAIGSGLSDVEKETSVAFDHLDCRSKSCLVDLHFKDYEAEQRTYMKFVAHGYGRKCGRELTGPAPADTTAPYTVTMVFNCYAESDAGAAPPAVP
jgi:hypothetical protein